MSSSTERARIRQRRTISYFVEAADSIIKEEGIGAVTIRRVADMAGYTSATLYNYFDNLNHLIFLATMNHLEEYNEAVTRRLAACGNSVQIYLEVSETFCEYSFRDPEIYNLLFFINQDEKVEEYTRQYYDLFEEKKKMGSSTLSKIIGINSIHRRSAIMLEDCVQDGYFTPENAGDFNEVALLLYRSILKDVREGKLPAGNAVEKTMKYYRQLMSFYIKPEWRMLVEA